MLALVITCYRPRHRRTLARAQGLTKFPDSPKSTATNLPTAPAISVEPTSPTVAISEISPVPARGIHTQKWHIYLGTLPRPRNLFAEELHGHVISAFQHWKQSFSGRLLEL